VANVAIINLLIAEVFFDNLIKYLI